MDSEKKAPKLTAVVDGVEVFTVEEINLMRRRREERRQTLILRRALQQSRPHVGSCPRCQKCLLETGKTYSQRRVYISLGQQVRLTGYSHITEE